MKRAYPCHKLNFLLVQERTGKIANVFSASSVKGSHNFRARQDVVSALFTYEARVGVDFKRQKGALILPALVVPLPSSHHFCPFSVILTYLEKSGKLLNGWNSRLTDVFWVVLKSFPLADVNQFRITNNF